MKHQQECRFFTSGRPCDCGGEVGEACAHNYVTSHGNGWECADCGEPLMSLSVPIPRVLFEMAAALSRSTEAPR